MRERGQGYLSWRDKGMPLASEETEAAHKQLLYNGKMGNPVLG